MEDVALVPLPFELGVAPRRVEDALAQELARLRGLGGRGGNRRLGAPRGQLHLRGHPQASGDGRDRGRRRQQGEQDSGQQRAHHGLTPRTPACEA
jgi:hypothetical protein